MSGNEVAAKRAVAYLQTTRDRGRERGGATMTTRGQGVVARGINQTKLEEMLIDPPGPGEVLVRILASGVCHTDLHIVHGLAPEGFPFLLGHEGAGIVEAVGPGVESPREGDHVMLAWRGAPRGGRLSLLC